MNRFVQLHMLTSHAPSNLNRDDLGRPKTAVMGGATRLRISSQSLKRAWRTSELFQSALAGHIGMRTKELGMQVSEKLKEKGVDQKKARSWSSAIAKQFGKLKSEKPNDEFGDLQIEQLAHFAPEELKAVEDLADKLAAENRAPNVEELELLRHGNSAVDIGMFGRMLAANPRFNVEAAVQVAHAITVHKVAVENDFFTAVDDLNNGDENLGAGHMGETEFGAGLFYQYVCIDRQLLLKNLDGDLDLTGKAIGALIESAAKVAPTGKQNSFASRARASFILCEKGDEQPRSLAVAFLDPVRGRDILDDSIARLADTRKNMDEVYGDQSVESMKLNVVTGKGRLADVIAFASE